MSEAGDKPSVRDQSPEDLSTTPYNNKGNPNQKQQSNGRRRSLRNKTVENTGPTESPSKKGAKPLRQLKAKPIPILKNIGASNPAPATLVQNSSNGHGSETNPQMEGTPIAPQQPQVQGFPQMFLPPPPLAFTPGFVNQNVGIHGIGVMNPLTSWAGMKDIRGAGVEEFLRRNWDVKMALLGWSPNRRMTASPANDAFVESFTQLPWKEQGNVVFFCAGGKVVRCHAVLLHGIIPQFTKQLLEMQAYPYSAYLKELPYIPVSLFGMEQHDVDNLIFLLCRGCHTLTGKEILQLKRIVEVLNISELGIYVAQSTPDFTPPGCASNERSGMQTVPPGLNLNPFLSMLLGSQWAPSVTDAAAVSQNASFSSPFQAEDSREIMPVRGRGDPDPPQVKVKEEPQDEVDFKTRAESTLLPSLPDDTESDSANENESLMARLKQRQNAEVEKQKDLSKTPLTDHDPSHQKNCDSTGLIETPRKSGTETAARALACEPISVEEEDGLIPWAGGISALAGPSMQSKTHRVSDVPVNKRKMKSPTPVRPTVARRRRGSGGGKRQRQISCEASISDTEEVEEAADVEVDKKRRTRTVYGKEVKVAAVRALSNGRSVRDVAETMNLPSKLISRWKYEASKGSNPNVPVVTLNDDPSAFANEDQTDGKESSGDADKGSHHGPNPNALPLPASIDGLLCGPPFQKMKIKEEPLDYYEGGAEMIQQILESQQHLFSGAHYVPHQVQQGEGAHDNNMFVSQGSEGDLADGECSENSSQQHTQKLAGNSQSPVSPDINFELPYPFAIATPGQPKDSTR